MKMARCASLCIPADNSKSRTCVGYSYELLYWLFVVATIHISVWKRVKLLVCPAGDHLSSPEERGAEGQLYVFKDFNWYDFRMQLQSVAALMHLDWLHVLPGGA
jgi:hypothetical protein